VQRNLALNLVLLDDGGSVTKKIKEMPYKLLEKNPVHRSSFTFNHGECI
jgi:hypothetical protein